jgi:multidrug efflux pump
MDKIATYVDDSVPETYRTFTIMGGGGGRTDANAATQNIYLKPPEERTRSQEEIHKQIMEDMNAFTGVRAFATQPPTIGDRRGGQYYRHQIWTP